MSLLDIQQPRLVSGCGGLSVHQSVGSVLDIQYSRIPCLEWLETTIILSISFAFWIHWCATFVVSIPAVVANVDWCETLKLIGNGYLQ